MSCDEDLTKFRGVSHWGEVDVTSEVENNLYSFINNAFLEIGAWQTVSSGYSTGPYGGDFSSLRLLNDPSYASGQIWQGPRKDWVWETGVSYTGIDGSGYSPTLAEIYVDGAAPTSNYGVNYKQGTVFFETPVSASADVNAYYCYRLVQVYLANDTEWWKQLQQQTLMIDGLPWEGDLDEGIYNILTQNRVQLPAVIIKADRQTSRPYQLGTTKSWVNQDVLFYVIAEDRFSRNKITDTLSRQKGRSFHLYDTDLVISNNDFPLSISGTAVSNAPEYRDYITDYKWQTVYWKDSSVSEVEALNSKLHLGIVRSTFELIA